MHGKLHHTGFDIAAGLAAILGILALAAANIALIVAEFIVATILWNNDNSFLGWVMIAAAATRIIAILSRYAGS